MTFILSQLYGISRKDNMKVKDLLEIQEIVEKRKTPCDMNGDLNKHYSKSKDEEMDILDMHLIHLVRSYSKSIEKTSGLNNTISNYVHSEKTLSDYKRGWKDALDSIEEKILTIK